MGQALPYRPCLASAPRDLCQCVVYAWHAEEIVTNMNAKRKCIRASFPVTGAVFLRHLEAKRWPLHVQMCRRRTMHLVLSWPP